MGKIEALEWLQERNCSIGEYDGKTFIIVEPMHNSTADDPLFEQVLLALGIDEDSNDYHWGYSDEFTSCDVCGTIIRTSPTHACWKPDFWRNEYEGEILCLKCTKESADDYLEWYKKEALEGVAHICLLDPEEYGFTKVIDDLEYGYHPGQNDDPRKLITWANENDFDIAFDVRQNPFTATFDVWLRGELCYKMDASTNTDGWGRITINVEQIRKLLLVSDSRYSHLRSQFREWPTPEEQMKAALKGAPKGG